MHSDSEITGDAVSCPDWLFDAKATIDWLDNLYSLVTSVLFSVFGLLFDDVDSCCCWSISVRGILAVPRMLLVTSSTTCRDSQVYNLHHSQGLRCVAHHNMAN